MLGKTIQPELNALIQSRDVNTLREVLSDLPSPDVAEVIQDIPERDQAVIFRLLPTSMAAETFERSSVLQWMVSRASSAVATRTSLQEVGR